MRGRRVFYHTSSVSLFQSYGRPHSLISYSPGFRDFLSSCCYILVCSFPVVPVLCCLVLLRAAKQGG